jgi:hypothetical protein
VSPSKPDRAPVAWSRLRCRYKILGPSHAKGFTDPPHDQAGFKPSFPHRKRRMVFGARYGEAPAGEETPILNGTEGRIC